MILLPRMCCGYPGAFPAIHTRSPTKMWSWNEKA